MEPFRPTRGGGARAWLAASEASLLRNLVGQVMTLIAPENAETPPGSRVEAHDEIAALEALLHASSSGFCRCGRKDFAKQIRVPGRGKRDGLWIGGAAGCHMSMQAFVVE